MEINKNKIKKFKELYKKYFDVGIDDNEAHEKAIKLVEFVKLLYKPTVNEEYKLIKNI